MVESRSETPTNPIADHCVADLSADRERHSGGRLEVIGYEQNSKRTTLSPTRRRGESRELPAGLNPTGHCRLRPSADDGPCRDGPLGPRGRHGCAYGHGTRASWPASSDSADRYASQNPLLKMYFCASRYSLGVAGALLGIILSDPPSGLSGAPKIGVW